MKKSHAVPFFMGDIHSALEGTLIYYETGGAICRIHTLIRLLRILRRTISFQSMAFSISL